MENKYVYVFITNNAKFPSAVFTSKKKAEEWILGLKTSGMLIRYPLNISVYDYVVSKGFFSPKNEEQKSNTYIAKFTSAYIKHYHYDFDENGTQDIG